jgi:hypothetical protein
MDLLKIREKIISDELVGSLTGIIHLIDSIQDCAAEILGEELVFNLKTNDDENV